MMQILSWTLPGRVSIDPIPIQNRSDLIEFLDLNAVRIESAWKLQIPLLSYERGYVFFEDGNCIQIRYNSEKPYSLSIDAFTSACYFSGKFENDGKRHILQGSYRFPVYLEFPRYIILAFFIYFISYFSYLIISMSVTLTDSIVFVLGATFLTCATVLWPGSVTAPTSILARNTMKKVDSLLAKYANRP